MGRLHRLAAVLSGGQRMYLTTSRTSNADVDDDFVHIGDVSARLRKKDTDPSAIVPAGYLNSNDQVQLRRLQWMMKKDQLEQDMCLVGPPGPRRRRLAMAFAELLQAPVQYVRFTRDTTEADLKQRREILNSSVVFSDSSAVRAVLRGHVLILDGIEKAERNVLPVLNNLLENREMALEDGRFVVASKRYDELLHAHGKERIAEWKLVRAHEAFRVIATMLPCPPFDGNPLDPPLRSRFQALAVLPAAKSIDGERMLPQDRDPALQLFRRKIRSLRHLVSIASSSSDGETMTDKDGLGIALSTGENIPRVCDRAEHAAAQILYHLRKKNIQHAEAVRYAASFILPRKSSVVETLLSTKDAANDPTMLTLVKVSAGRATIRCRSFAFEVKVPCGSAVSGIDDVVGRRNFVLTETQSDALARMVHAHAVSDFAIIGPSCSGKSLLVRRFAALLGYDEANVRLVCCYKEMTSPDLLFGRRATDRQGNTTWVRSAVARAALAGELLVLDGVHHLDASTLAALQQLVTDRVLSLPDETILSTAVHPSFRIVCTGIPPDTTAASKGSSANRRNWLTEEIASTFLWIKLPQLTADDERTVLRAHVPDASSDVIEALCKLRARLDLLASAAAGGEIAKSLGVTLTTRKFIRASRRARSLSALRRALEQTCLAPYLPSVVRGVLRELLDGVCGAESATITSTNENTVRGPPRVEGNTLFIDGVSRTLTEPVNPLLVPSTLFYDNPAQTRIMGEMLRDWNDGDSLLLVGPQGVGKNKMADRFLELLRLPREYLQLHRDTTIGQLTTIPTIRNGVVRYEDSPLVRAVQMGHVLVIDEADKAPAHVTVLLKALADDRYMQLADGRRIVGGVGRHGRSESGDIIPMHENFRMIVLGNRPGYPFQGNDFHTVVSGVFAEFAIDNPDAASEMQLLRRYAASVPEATLARLQSVFTDLRTLVERSELSYPYSTREIVAVARHLERYPKDSVGSALRAIFDFEHFAPAETEIVTRVLRQHGIVLGEDEGNFRVALGAVATLPPFRPKERWILDRWQAMTPPWQPLPVDSERQRRKTKNTTYVLNDGSGGDRRWDARTERFTEASYRFKMLIRGEYAVADAVGLSNVGSPFNVAAAVLVAGSRCAAVKFVSLDATMTGVPTATVRDPFANVSGPSSLGSFGRIPRASDYALHEVPGTQCDVCLHDRVAHRICIVSPPSPSSPSSQAITVELEFPVTENVRRVSQTAIASSKHWGGWIVLAWKPRERTLLTTTPLGDGSVILPKPLLSASSIENSADGDDVWMLHFCDGSRGEIRLLPSTSSSDPRWVSCDLRMWQAELGRTLRTGTTTAPMCVASSATALANKSVESEMGRLISLPRGTVTAIDVADVLTLAPTVDTTHATLFGAPRPASLDGGYDTAVRAASAAYMRRSQQLVTTYESVVEDVGSAKREGATKDGSSRLLILEIVSLRTNIVRRISSETAETDWSLVYPSDGSSRGTWPYAASRDADGIFPRFVCTELANAQMLSVDRSTGIGTVYDVSSQILRTRLDEWAMRVGQDDGGGKLRVGRGRGKGGRGQGRGRGRGQGRGRGRGRGRGQGRGQGQGKGSGSGRGQGSGGKGKAKGRSAEDILFDLPNEEDEERRRVEAVRRGLPNRRKKGDDDNDGNSLDPRDVAKLKSKAWAELLARESMSPKDFAQYERYKTSVSRETRMLRHVLRALEAKEREREWLTHREDGELDYRRLVEGLAGDRAVYRRRGVPDTAQRRQRKPKRLRFLFDCSMSMSRYAYDGRLRRSIEAAVMIMEAFRGDELRNKYEYGLFGHSGDTDGVCFAEEGKPPKSEAARFGVVRRMNAHTQFTDSGDNTLEAAERAIREIVTKPADEYCVFLLSDANLEAYGIGGTQLSRVIRMDPRVRVFILFIGSLGDQAQRLCEKTPPGRCRAVLETSAIPRVLRECLMTVV